MIRFDKVPIDRKFKHDGLDWAKTSKCHAIHIYYGDEIFPQVKIVTFSSEDMVELVDKCANCKFFSEGGFCNSHAMRITKEIQRKFDWIKADPETFKCSEWEKKR